MHYYLNIAERWFRAKPGNIMRTSNLLRRPEHAFALFILPLLAFTLASPAGAEPASNPPSAEKGGNPPTAPNGGYLRAICWPCRHGP